MSAIPDTEAASGVGSDALPLPGHPGYWYGGLDDRLADALIERTLDADDVRLREMTRDLGRFATRGQLDRWLPGHDLLILQDGSGAFLGLFWVVDKPLPAREDYLNPALLRRLDPRITCAIRTYGVARGHGILTKAFAERALNRLLDRRGDPDAVWYETKSENLAARALGRQLGFIEVSGDADGRVVGVRPTSSDRSKGTRP